MWSSAHLRDRKDAEHRQGWEGVGGGFSPILEQDVIGALRGVGLGRLRGPTLVEAKQEEVWRLRDLDLHVHLGHPVLPSQ